MRLEDALNEIARNEKLVNSEYPNWLFFMFYPVDNAMETILINGIGIYPLAPFWMAKNEDDVVKPYTFSEYDKYSESWEIVV
jgi:hypothetical protein